jgi:hypothetical protein
VISPHPVYTNDLSSLLTAVRELYSRRPETYYLEPWELQHTLFSLSYTDNLADEAEIAAAIEVARTDYDPDAAA